MIPVKQVTEHLVLTVKQQNKLMSEMHKSLGEECEIRAEISQLISSSSDLEPSQPTRSARMEVDGSSSKELPAGKETHFFGSHKKEHSVYGDTSESLGIRLKDILEAQNGLKGWFDLDDLKQIDQESINAGIRSTSCLLVLLTDETKLSEWCRAEWECARENNIGIIVVIDVDKFPSRALIKSYVEAGWSWLFENQVINYSSSHRKACYGMIAQAIEDVVQRSASTEFQSTTATPEHKPVKAATSKDTNGGIVHEVNMDAAAIDAQLRQLVKQQYDSVEAFFNDVTSGDSISRKEWKAALHHLGMRLSDAARKGLRKRIAKGGSKVIRLKALSAFIGEAMVYAPTAGADNDSQALCFIPAEVPDLPAKFQARDGPLNVLIDALISKSSTTVSLTAPTSRQSNKIMSHGMGGCGKTVLTVAAVLSMRVRKHFQRIAWATVSQKPNVSEIQSKLYTQLSDDALPDNAVGNVGVATQLLITLCRGRMFLVVLDDVWDPAVEKQLSFLDDSSQSRLLISTRIKGLVTGSKEVQVQLLTNKEAIEMLCSMAELDTTGIIPNEVMPIVRLCGNLPLCVGVVAGMIRANTDAGSTQEAIAEVLTILQDDKAGALTEEAEFSVSDLVVGRSVRSLPSQDAQILFKYLGACPEDAQMGLDFIVVLWEASRHNSSQSKFRLKSATRKLVGLLTINNLLHKSTTFFSMHDIVRDFSRQCIGDVEALSTLQRSVVNAVVKNSPPGGWEAPVAIAQKTLKDYVKKNLSHHISEALVNKDEIDPDAICWLATSDDPFNGHVVCETSRSLGIDALVSWAAIFKKMEGKALQAARLLACAAFVGLDGTSNIERNDGSDLLKEATSLLQSTSSPTSNGDYSSTCTLEFSCCRELFLRMDYTNPAFLKYVNRAVELAPSLGSLSPLQTAGLGTTIQFTGQALGGWLLAGAGNHLRRECMQKAAAAAMKGPTLMAQGSDQLNDDDPLQVAFDATILNLYQGYNIALWFTDPNVVDSVCSYDRVARTIDRYQFDLHNVISHIVGYQLDCYMWAGGCAAISKFGDLTRMKKFLGDMLSVPAAHTSFETALTMVFPILTLCSWGHRLCRFAKFGSDALQIMRMYKMTFGEVDRTIDCAVFNFLQTTVGWEVEGGLCCHSKDYWVDSKKTRHFLLQQSDINQQQFIHGMAQTDADKYCINPVSMWQGGDYGEVCLRLGMHQEGIRRAKLDLSRFKFNPIITPSCMLALAQLLEDTGCDDESSACYCRTVSELRRTELRMFELMALCQKRSGQDKAIEQAVSKMVEKPAAYAPLVESNTAST